MAHPGASLAPAPTCEPPPVPTAGRPEPRPAVPAVPPATAPPSRRRTVLMDFDGVIVREDSLGAFLRHRLARDPLRMPAFLAATSALAPILGVPASRAQGLRLLLRAGFAGMTHAEYLARAGAFGTALGARSENLLAPGVAAARSHLEDGDRVVVVTGSEETLARAVLRAAGLEGVELVASRVGVTPFGLAFVVHAYGPGKLDELRARGIHPPWDVAYSDSAVDLPMLRGARRAVLVNVGQRAGARVRTELGARVVDVSWG